MAAFERFVFYRDMSRRSVADLCEVFGVKKTTLDEQCQKYQWVARASAWDAELDRRVREVEVSELKKMQAQQIKVGEGLMLVGARELQQLQFKQKRADDVALAGGFVREPLLPAREIVRLIDAGTRIVRLNHEQPTNLDLHTVNVGVTTTDGQNDKGSTKGLSDDLVELIRQRIMKGSAQ